MGAFTARIRTLFKPGAPAVPVRQVLFAGDSLMGPFPNLETAVTEGLPYLVHQALGTSFIGYQTYAVPNVTTAHILNTQVPQIIAAKDPTGTEVYCVFDGGINDAIAGSGINAAQSYSNIIAIAAALNAAGIRPIWIDMTTARTPSLSAQWAAIDAQKATVNANVQANAFGTVALFGIIKASTHPDLGAYDAGLSTVDHIDGIHEKLLTGRPKRVAMVVSALQAAAAGQTSIVIADPRPLINSFAPSSASAGNAVVIAGLSLAGATAVTINGLAATYTVDSPTQITATVPALASTGAIAVTTPAGSYTSLTSLTVTGANQALRLSGGGGNYASPASNDLVVSTAVEVEWRCALPTTRSQAACYLTSLTPGSGDSWAILYGFTAGKFEFYSSTATPQIRVAFPAASTDGLYHTYKVVYASSSVSLYVDNVLVVGPTAVTASIPAPSLGSLVFHLASRNAPFWQGDLDFYTVTIGGVLKLNWQLTGNTNDATGNHAALSLAGSTSWLTI